MKKLLLNLFISATVLCLAVCGCSKDTTSTASKGSDKSSPTKTPSLSYTVFSHYNSPTTTFYNGYVFETNEYVFYRNNADNGYLYRLEKSTNEKKVIFNKNENFNLHSIKVTQNYVYFTAQTESDAYLTLYRCNLDGENLERLAEKVEEYIIADNAVFYIEGMKDENLYIRKYSLEDKTNSSFYEKSAEGLNSVGKNLYFVLQNENSIVEYNTENNTEIQIKLPDDIKIHSKLFYYNGMLYFNSTIKDVTGKNSQAIYCYNLSDKTFKKLIDLSLFDEYNQKYSSTSINEFLINPDETLYVSLRFMGEKEQPNIVSHTKVFHIKNNKILNTYETDDGNLLFHCEGKLCFFNPNNSSDALIKGNDKYNETVS